MRENFERLIKEALVENNPDSWEQLNQLLIDSIPPSTDTRKLINEEIRACHQLI